MRQTPVINGEILSYNNMLVESVGAGKDRQVTLYVPHHKISSAIAAKEQTLAKVHNVTNDTRTP
ncbi:hypothetical protein ACFL6C_14460 [Myxococcota bacterium]